MCTHLSDLWPADRTDSDTRETCLMQDMLSHNLLLWVFRTQTGGRIVLVIVLVLVAEASVSDW